jgi:hypothetical protein
LLFVISSAALSFAALIAAFASFALFLSSFLSSSFASFASFALFLSSSFASFALFLSSSFASFALFSWRDPGATEHPYDYNTSTGSEIPDPKTGPRHCR